MLQSLRAGSPYLARNSYDISKVFSKHGISRFESYSVNYFPPFGFVLRAPVFAELNSAKTIRPPEAQAKQQGEK
jgi:hypothetical protein